MNDTSLHTWVSEPACWSLKKHPIRYLELINIYEPSNSSLYFGQCNKIRSHSRNPAIILNDNKQNLKLSFESNGFGSIEIVNSSLSNVPDNIFIQSYKLFILNMSYNDLTTFSLKILEKCQELSIVDLSYNNIHSIGNTEDTYSTHFLKILDLSGNRIKTFSE